MAPSISESISIRPYIDSDADAVGSVSQRDSSRAPTGVLLVAEVDGQVRAALSLDTGEVVADPFAATTALVDLLRIRARQLTSRPGPRRRRRRALLDRRPAQDAVGAPARI